MSEFPETVVARSGRAEVLKSQNRLGEALAAYESVIADFPEGVVARNAPASRPALRRRWEEARSILPGLSPITEQDWIGYHIRAMVLLRMGRLEEAIEILVDG